MLIPLWSPPGSTRSAALVQVKLSYVAIALDYKLDESYTPSKLSIRAGTGYHDLKELKVLEVNEPNGWQLVQLEPPNPECVPLEHGGRRFNVCVPRLM